MADERPDFCDVLTDIGNGKVHERLTQKLHEVTRAVEDTGKSGEVILKMIIKADGGLVHVGCDVKSKVPEKPVPSAIFFSDGEGGLHRDNPNQTNLFENRVVKITRDDEVK